MDLESEHDDEVASRPAVERHSLAVAPAYSRDLARDGFTITVGAQHPDQRSSTLSSRTRNHAHISSLPRSINERYNLRHIYPISALANPNSRHTLPITYRPMASIPGVCRHAATLRSRSPGLWKDGSRGEFAYKFKSDGCTDRLPPALHTSSRQWAAQNFVMPAMSPTMTEGNIASWKVKEGTFPAREKRDVESC